MERIADAFAWPLRDPAWPVKTLVIGLLMLIPIAGVINGIGWMLATLDRLRAGDETLPPANLSYIGRGARLFVVEIVYAAALSVTASIVYSIAIAIFVREGSGPVNGGLIAAGVLVNVIAFAIFVFGSLAINFALPAIVLATDRGGIGGGLRMGAIVHRVKSSITDSLIAGLMLIAASFIGSLGLICIVGIFFTFAYSLAMQAWIVRSYEVGSTTATA